MKVKSELVLKAVNIIELVPSRAGIPASEFIRLSATKGQLSFAMSADVFGEVAVPSGCSEKWTAFVDRCSFTPFVNASRESGSCADFTFKYSDGNLVVRCGRRKGVFNKLTNVSGYSEASSLSGTKVTLSKDQRHAITLAAAYATPDPTIAHLNCVYVEKNGYVLASNERGAVRIQTKAVGAAMPIPLGVLKTIDHEAATELVLGKKIAKIGFDIGYICQSVNQKAAHQFPTKAIASSFASTTDYPRRFKVSAKKFIDAMARLNDYSSMVVKRDSVVKITGVKGESLLKLVCQVPQGQFVETLPLDKPLKTDVKAEWLLELLVPLTMLKRKVAMFSAFFEESGKTPYLITAPGFELLLSRRMTK